MGKESGKYAERLQTLSDSELRREWSAESGEHRQQIEHEMAARFRKPVVQLDYLNKFLDLPRQFREAYSAREWYHAKHIYDTAITVGLFLEIPDPLRSEFFGLSDEDSPEIQGMIPRDMVSWVYKQCAVKDNLGNECVVYRLPGEIGFYGAKHLPGATRIMPAEENPAYWIKEDPMPL